jgi:hypothetical protein
MKMKILTVAGGAALIALTLMASTANARMMGQSSMSSRMSGGDTRVNSARIGSSRMFSPDGHAFGPDGLQARGRIKTSKGGGKHWRKFNEDPPDDPPEKPNKGSTGSTKTSSSDDTPPHPPYPYYGPGGHYGGHHGGYYGPHGPHFGPWCHYHPC